MSSTPENQFQTENPPLSTASANARPNASAQSEATTEAQTEATEQTSALDAAIESNGATAAADKTPGEIRSHNAPPQQT